MKEGRSAHNRGAIGGPRRIQDTQTVSLGPHRASARRRRRGQGDSHRCALSAVSLAGIVSKAPARASFRSVCARDTFWGSTVPARVAWWAALLHLLVQPDRVHLGPSQHPRLRRQARQHGEAARTLTRAESAALALDGRVCQRGATGGGKTVSHKGLVRMKDCASRERTIGLNVHTVSLHLRCVWRKVMEAKERGGGAGLSRRSRCGDDDRLTPAAGAWQCLKNRGAAC